MSSVPSGNRPPSRRPRWKRAVIACGLTMFMIASIQVGSLSVADAHGAATNPGSRTYLCRLDGTGAGGDIEPKNPACAAAVAQGGKQPLWDWFGVLRGDGQGRTEGFIPDGQLCSGGEPKFGGFDRPGDDWPHTRLTAGGTINFRYNAWAAHPGQFRMYITDDDYDPSSPLAWSDLESEPFSTYDQTQPNGTDTANGSPDYRWDATLPDKSGRHIIYSVWERSDSAETFYGCSDVVFDGGNGEVVGIGGGDGPPPPPPPDTTTPDTTTPETTTTSTGTTDPYPTTTDTSDPGSTAPGTSNPDDPSPVDDGLGSGYWSTQGPDLVDGNGDEVKIRGVNWFGFETAASMPHGLWERNWRSMIDQIADLKFNTLRLPFSSALLDPGVMPNGLNAAVNTDVADYSSLELMDAIIDYAGERGVKVILDRHALGPDNRNKLWYDDQYPEDRFISDWQLLAERYQGNTTVIGADIYNEPHDEACWGCGDPAVDWHMAAEEAGNAIHAINPGWLIFVEGVEHADGADCEILDDGCNWWGGNLLGAEDTPVELNEPNKVVYSPHEYATSVHRQPWFDDPAFPSNLPSIWDRYWGYLEQAGTAPVMVGEFGSTLEAQEDQVWLEDLLAYMDQNGIGFTFWTFNPNSGDTGGVLNDDWNSVNQDRYGLLEPYLLGPFGSQDPPPPNDPTTTDPPTTDTSSTDTSTTDTTSTDTSSTNPTTDPFTPDPTDPTGSTTSTSSAPTSTDSTTTTQPGPPGTETPCAVEIDIHSWDSAYVAQVKITNTGAATIDGWALSWDFGDGEELRQSWGADIMQSGEKANAMNRTWNSVLAPGESAAIGFIASHDGSPDNPPSTMTLNGVTCL